MNTQDGLPAYDFLAPQRIVFGWGRRAELSRWAKDLGERAFVILGSRTLERTGQVDRLLTLLEQAGIAAQIAARITREPEPADVNAAVARLVADQAGPGDFVLAVGGGSALDLGKATAALVPQASRNVVDYLEGVGKGLTPTQPPLPLLAMPTTAGTGSEATKNAVITSYAPAFKKSLRDDRMLPRTVLIDPELTLHLSAEATAAGGLDCITQLIESAISLKSAPIPRALALDGLARALPALETLAERPTNRSARERMSHAALLSGLALANSGLGLAHGIAAGLGALYRVPHGLACAALLPTAIRYNRPVAEPMLAELARAAAPAGRSLSDAEAVDGLLTRLDALLARWRIAPGLSGFGVSPDKIPALAAASQGNSLAGNPRPLPPADLEALLRSLP